MTHSQFSHSARLRTVSPSFLLLSKHIDNPDAYPVQIMICLDETNWTKFKLCREEEEFKLKVDDVNFDELEFRAASLAP